MSEHPFAGKTVTLSIDGEEVECQLEDGISQEKGEEVINSMLGVDASDSQTDVNHPDLEFANIPPSEYPEPKGLRTVCRIDGCEHTQVFETLDAIKGSEWTELGMPKGLLSDMTDLHYAYCPHHNLDEDEGYEPERDMASNQFNETMPQVEESGLDD